MNNPEIIDAIVSEFERPKGSHSNISSEMHEQLDNAPTEVLLKRLNEIKSLTAGQYSVIPNKHDFGLTLLKIQAMTSNFN